MARRLSRAATFGDGPVVTRAVVYDRGDTDRFDKYRVVVYYEGAPRSGAQVFFFADHELKSDLENGWQTLGDFEPGFFRDSGKKIPWKSAPEYVRRGVIDGLRANGDGTKFWALLEDR